MQGVNGVAKWWACHRPAPTRNMKDTAEHIRQGLKRLLLGSASVHQYRPIGLRDPQSEVSVWLHGLGPPRDVTDSNVAASTKPVTLGIGFEKDLHFTTVRRARLSLKFREREGEKRLLGEIDLRPIEAIPLDDGQLCLFQPESCKNYCATKPRLWARYLYIDFQQRRARKRSRVRERQITAGHLHCLFVFYICPRPVVLVTAAHANCVNIVPMDLLGPVSARCFSLALHCTSTAAPLFDRSRRIAVSSVPFEQAAVVYRLGGNHKAPCVDMNHLPFETTDTIAFGLPVPRFALRVREMKIESVRTVGSYRVFLASAVEDRRLAEGAHCFLVHGFYQRLAASSALSSAAAGS